MEKRTFREIIADREYLEFVVPIRELIDLLLNDEKEGATHVELSSYDSTDFVFIESFYERMETDEELALRREEDNRIKNEIERREMRELERLKAKYEK